MTRIVSTKTILNWFETQTKQTGGSFGYIRATLASKFFCYEQKK